MTFDAFLGSNWWLGQHDYHAPVAMHVATQQEDKMLELHSGWLAKLTLYEVALQWDVISRENRRAAI